MFESKEKKFQCCGCGTLLDGITLSVDQQIFLFEGKTQKGQTNNKSYDVDADDSAVIDGARPKRILMLMPILISWPSWAVDVMLRELMVPVLIPLLVLMPLW